MWIRLTLIAGIVCGAVLAAVSIVNIVTSRFAFPPPTSTIASPQAPVAPSSSQPPVVAGQAVPKTQAPPRAPAKNGNATDAEKMAALRKAIEDLPKGNIVLAAPSKMTVGDEREVKASVGVDVPIEKLRQQSSPSNQQKEGSLYTSLEMVATLSGPGFTIQQTTPENQSIAEGFPTVWSWNVTAKQEGEQTLEATLYVIIGENRIRVESYTDTISVSVRPQTWGEWLKSLGDELGAVKSILVAIGGIVTLILSWLGYKRMSPHKKRPPKSRRFIRTLSLRRGGLRRISPEFLGVR